MKSGSGFRRLGPNEFQYYNQDQQGHVQVTKTPAYVEATHHVYAPAGQYLGTRVGKVYRGTHQIGNGSYHPSRVSSLHPSRAASQRPSRRTRGFSISNRARDLDDRTQHLVKKSLVGCPKELPADPNQITLAHAYAWQDKTIQLSEFEQTVVPSEHFSGTPIEESKSKTMSRTHSRSRRRRRTRRRTTRKTKRKVTGGKKASRDALASPSYLRSTRAALARGVGVAVKKSEIRRAAKKSIRVRSRRSPRQENEDTFMYVTPLTPRTSE